MTEILHTHTDNLFLIYIYIYTHLEYSTIVHSLPYVQILSKVLEGTTWHVLQGIKID